jgi:uncharacterized YigZ family protein
MFINQDMMKNDSFLTLASPSSYDFKEKASKFIGYAYPVETEEECQVIVQNLWKQHHKATHVCYAYKLGLGNDRFRINDDGEPSGSAGNPIYGQILSKGLTDVLICVVRYYGGVKLGVSGLITAYKEAANEVLNQSTFVEKVLAQSYILKTDYEHMGQIMNILKDEQITLIHKQFLEHVELTIALSLSEIKPRINRIKARMLNYELDRINDETQIDFCDFLPSNYLKI